MLVLHHHVKTSVNLKFQISIINKDPSQLVPQSTEGDFRDLWPLINMIIMSSHDMSPASKYSPSQLREWPRRRRRYGHGNMSVKAPPPLYDHFPEIFAQKCLKIVFFAQKKHLLLVKKVTNLGVWCGGCRVWWMSGAVAVWCGECPFLPMVWWMSGVVDI